MRCIAKTRDNTRCKRKTRFLFCSTHQGPFLKILIPTISIFILVGSAIIWSTDLFEAIGLNKPIDYITSEEKTIRKFNLFSEQSLKNRNNLNIQILPFFPNSKCSNTISNYEHILKRALKDQISHESNLQIKIDTSQDCNLTDAEAFEIGLRNNSNIVFWGFYDQKTNDSTIVEVKYSIINKRNPIILKRPSAFRSYVREFSGQDALESSQLSDNYIITAIRSLCSHKGFKIFAHHDSFDGTSGKIRLDRTSDFENKENLKEILSLSWLIAAQLNAYKGSYNKAYQYLDSLIQFKNSDEIMYFYNRIVKRDLNNQSTKKKEIKALNKLCNENEKSSSCIIGNALLNEKYQDYDIKNTLIYLSIASNTDKYHYLANFRNSNITKFHKHFKEIIKYFPNNDCLIQYFEIENTIKNLNDKQILEKEKQLFRSIISEECRFPEYKGSFSFKEKLLRYAIEGAYRTANFDLGREGILKLKEISPKPFPDNRKIAPSIKELHEFINKYDRLFQDTKNKI